MGKSISDLHKAAWSSATDYTPGDIVTLSGSSYVCIANNTNQTPPNATYWGLLASAGDFTLSGAQTITGIKTFTTGLLKAADVIDTVQGLIVTVFSGVASAVNRITFTNAATGDNPKIEATGSDTNIGLTLKPKGSGVVVVDGPENYAADAEASDTYVVAIEGISAYVTGLPISFKANTANTGAATLNVNALGAITIKKNHDQDLATGDIEAGQIVDVVYDGTNFQMQSQTASAAAEVANDAYEVTPTNAQTTTSTSFVDMDSGTQEVIIAETSHVLVTGSANVTNNTNGVYSYIQLTYDSGGADTVVGKERHAISISAGQEFGITTHGIVKNLAAGTYTFAIQKRAGSNTSTFHNPNLSILVIPA